MNILALIKPAFAALKYGSSLSNPAFWANVGGVTVVLRLVRDAAQAFFPDVALISDDIVGHGADFIAGLVGAYLLYASNKDAGIKFPPIALQAVSEPESQNAKAPCTSNQNQLNDLPAAKAAHEEAYAKLHRPIRGYEYPANGRWLHKPKLQSESSSASESETVGFGDKN